jgi:hypothetical protein
MEIAASTTDRVVRKICDVCMVCGLVGVAYFHFQIIGFVAHSPWRAPALSAGWRLEPIDLVTELSPMLAMRTEAEPQTGASGKVLEARMLKRRFRYEMPLTDKNDI